jgi:signal transduction histidine kinase
MSTVSERTNSKSDTKTRSAALARAARPRAKGKALTARERDITVEFLRLVNESTGTRDLIRGVTAFFQQQSGCEAVGVRLRQEGDYPYFETRGFPPQFVRAENSLCARDRGGQIVCDQGGNPVLECMCGNVICGRFDPEQRFFTKQGSFWTNSTTQLLASTTETERKVQTRNRCHGQGYESVALIPLRMGEQRLGLLQLNDRRRGVFTPELIRFWERLADQLAVALAKFLADEELHRLNQELDQRVRERTAQLEAAVKELEAFSYSVSHDLRAPLRAIDGFASILAEEHGGRLDPEGLRVMSVIRKEAARMGQLITDLLAFSRVGRSEMRSAGIDMTCLAQAVFDECAGHLPDRRLQLKLDPLLPAWGDPSLVRQVLTNLLSNALKYTSPREVGRIELGSREEGRNNVYWVKDNGVGFDPRYSDKLFGIFQRLHNEEEFEGTGVGLALVQRIIHRHGGQIWGEGQVEAGATFFFTLPRSAAVA